MKVNSGPMAKGLKSASGMLTSFEAKVQQSGASLKALFAGAAAYKAVDGFKSMVSGASHLNEAMSKTSAVFGADASTVVAAADEMAGAFGASKKEFLANASTLGNTFEGAGMAAKEAAALSVQFVKLAADVKSFNDLTPEEAFNKLKAGLAGEAEPLRDLGVTMTEEMVKAKAATLGFRAQGGELSALAKIHARAAIIMEKTVNAQGDLVRTGNGVENASTGLAGRIGNISDALGTYFLPATQQALGALNRFANSIYSFVGTAGPGITSFVDGAVAAWDTFSAGIGGVISSLSALSGAWSGPASVLAGGLSQISSLVDDVGYAWRNLPALVEVAALQWGEKITNMIAFAKTIPQNLQIIGAWVGSNWRTLMVDAANGVGAAFENLGTNLAALGSSIVAFLKDPTQGFTFNWTPLLKGFEATTAKLPELIKPSLVSLQSEIDGKLAAIGAAETARTGRLAASAAERAKLAADAMAGSSDSKKPAPAAERTAESPKFASAMTAGSQAAANTIQRSRYGAATAKGPADATAKNTAATSSKLDKTNALLAGLSARLGIQAGSALGSALAGNF